MGFIQKVVGLRVSFVVLFAIGILGACTRKESPIGTEKNPVKFLLLPSVDAAVMSSKGRLLEKYLETQTGLSVDVAIPQSFVAVVESFGTERADVATLNAIGYIMAHERYGAEALLMTVRFGSDSYRAQILVPANSPIKKVEDINGKKFAFVDPLSTSGYLMPLDLLNRNNVKPSDTVFAKKHDSVVTMIYQGQVDAGATFHTPANDGKIQDARRLVKTQFPDIEDKVKILTLTDAIPNDPIVFRKGLPAEIKTKIVDALMAYIGTDEGKETLHAVYGITGLKTSTDATYDPIRKMLESTGKAADELLTK